jgi:hypothetical protein
MKYWKQFWDSLNEGWKRIHYLGIPILCIFLFPVAAKGTTSDEMPFVLAISVGFAMVTYYLLITAIYWIKEGFQSKDEPTKEDE